MKTIITILSLFLLSFQTVFAQTTSEWLPMSIGFLGIDYRTTSHTIDVPLANANLKKLKILVEANPIYFSAINFTFDNNERQSFSLEQEVKTGKYSNEIVLDKNSRSVRKITLFYKFSNPTKITPVLRLMTKS